MHSDELLTLAQFQEAQQDQQEVPDQSSSITGTSLQARVALPSPGPLLSSVTGWGQSRLSIIGSGGMAAGALVPRGPHSRFS